MPSYQVARSIHIDASPNRIFEIVADHRTWTTWSPWLIVEPETKVTVSGDPCSLGSRYSWKGEITGQGELEHKRLHPGELVEDELRFLKPFKTTCKITFALSPQGDGTNVTWTMDGNMPWFLFWMIPMMKTFIGMDYRRGLAMLKDWVETGTIPSTTIVHGVTAVGPLRMAGIAGSCSVDSVALSMKEAFEQAHTEFAQLGLPTDGPMISVYKRFRVQEGIFEYICGFVIPPDAPIPASSKITTWSLPACQAFYVEHIGSDRHLGNGWSVANQLVRHKKLKQQRVGTLEIYRTTAPETQQAELRTEIYLPLK